MWPASRTFFNHNLGSFTVNGDFGSMNYDSNVGPSGWAVRGAAGHSYMIDNNKEVTLDGHIRQVKSGESPYVATNAGFKMSF